MQHTQTHKTLRHTQIDVQTQTYSDTHRHTTQAAHTQTHTHTVRKEKRVKSEPEVFSVEGRGMFKGPGVAGSLAL